MATNLIKVLANLFERLVRSLRNSSTTIEPSLYVELSEEIAIFVRQGKLLHKGSKRLRAEALEPRLFNGRLETSVCRSSGITHAEVWLLAKKHFERPPDLLAKAIAFSKADQIYTAGLHFDADGKPYSRHANIIGWNASKKHAWKLQAQKAAAHFTYEERGQIG